MTQERNFVTLLDLLAERPESDEENELLERVKLLAQENLPEGWIHWKAMRSLEEDIFGPSVEERTLNKLTFALPTVGLVRAFDPEADHLTEEGYRQIKQKLLGWAFTRALILSPIAVAKKIHGSSFRMELFKRSIEPVRPLLLTRAEASSILSGHQTKLEVTDRRTCFDLSMGRRRKRDLSPEDEALPKKSREELLEERLNIMFKIVMDKMADFVRGLDSDKENKENED
ncbi:hypothetical protein ABMA28_008672 [Loxostege sticticalis]|uniref:Uncharacterized protein n=1 Tax=Loxostege sticticalis TaxID=481309 RepID=A0ABD0SE85_LOXSC